MCNGHNLRLKNYHDLTYQLRNALFEQFGMPFQFKTIHFSIQISTTAIYAT